MQDLWNDVLDHIDEREGTSVLEGVRDLYRECRLERTGNRLLLVVPNGFVSRLVSGRHQESIISACKVLTGLSDLKFSISVSEEKKAKKPRQTPKPPLPVLKEAVSRDPSW